MAHTHGPWIWDEPSNWHGLQARVCTEKYEPIAQVQISGWPRKIGKANAALIAAAPELLEALEKLAARFAIVAPDDTGLSEEDAARLNAARAAIAKAKGETP